MVIMNGTSWILTTFLTLIIIQSSLLNLIIAQNLDYPSVVYPPLSWRNGLSSKSNFGSLQAAGVKPILVNGNFVCGFHCTSTTPETCFFAISFFNTSFAAATAENSNPFPEIVIVWSANRNNPVELEAELKFTQQGDMVLQDAHGALVWSTNTRAARLNLTHQGNLLLFDKTNKVLWQSFDHPTDSLLPGQRLVYGQKLRSSQSETNMSEGLYSFTIDDHGYFMAYMEPDPSQVYYWSDKVYSRTKTGRFYTELEDIARLFNSTFTLIKIRSDGHLMGYQSTNSSWTESMDILGINQCNYPLVCGEYGLCSESSDSTTCSCPGVGGEFYGENTYHFRPINFTQTNLGCFPFQPIVCESSHDHQSMLKLEEGYYINAFTLASYINHTADEETCKQACLSNCSCKAAIFRQLAIFRQFNTTFIDCTLASEVFSIGSNFYYYFYYKNYEGLYDMYNKSTYIKVQNSSPTQTTLEKNSLSVPVVISPKKRRAVIMGSTFGSIFGLLLLCTTIFVLVKKYSKKVDEEDYLDHIISGLPTRFSYEELRVITKNFSIKLGEGGFGSVFQGTLLNGDEVAVKHLAGLDPVNKSFITEVQTIGSIHHFNLVSLVGYCAEKFHKLLIYEYMCNGSLERWIFNKNKEQALSWQSRKKIILDIAKGLAYLHEDCKQKIIHLDIKPQNILLDENLNAKISDFGLSKLIGRNQSQVVTTMRGTPGYMAPEWLSSVITEKVDVYSFGIVVLEILCGRPNVDRSQAEEDMDLMNLFRRKAEEEQLEDLVDKHGDEMQSNASEVVETMKVAACCLHSEIRRRPSMSTVVKVLEGSMNIEYSLSFDFSNLPEPEAVATDSLILATSLSGPR